MAIQITGGSASAPAASETVAGVVELATTIEAATGTDTARAVTPAGLALRKIGDGWALGSGGNARGVGAVDLQITRSDPAGVASGGYATVGGGLNNTASGTQTTVGGGKGNTASEINATIGGGYQNAASGTYATVGGGQSNFASGTYATVGGGQNNTASGTQTTVGGGKGNTASEINATVGGGQNNTASGTQTTVGGGKGNTASGTYATVGGGYQNAASGTNSAILGGNYNNTNGLADAMIVGSNITALLANAMHCNQLVITQIPVASVDLPSGAIWSDGGILKIVP